MRCKICCKGFVQTQFTFNGVMENKSGITLQKNINITTIRNITRCVLWGNRKWNLSEIAQDLSNNTIKYSINGSLKKLESDGNPKYYTDQTSAHETMIQTMMTNLSNYIIPITFEYTTDFNESIFDFNLALSSFPPITGYVGYANPPGFSEGWTYGSDKTSYDSDGCIYMNMYYAHTGYTNTGSWFYTVLLHELGHALSLAHPHDTGGGQSRIMPGVKNSGHPGKYGQNNFIYTVMSYRDTDTKYGTGSITGYGYAQNFMAIDVAALQWMYGRTTDISGNNTYILSTETTNSWRVIYDNGGINTIDGSGAGTGLLINTEKANLKLNSIRAGGHISRSRASEGGRGGLLICNGSKIDIVNGSNYNDIIIGRNCTINTGQGNNDIRPRGNVTINCGNGNNIIRIWKRNITVSGGSGTTKIIIRRRRRFFNKVIVDKTNNRLILKKKGIFATCNNITSFKFRGQKWKNI